MELPRCRHRAGDREQGLRLTAVVVHRDVERALVGMEHAVPVAALFDRSHHRGPCHPGLLDLEVVGP